MSQRPKLKLNDVLDGDEAAKRAKPAGAPRAKKADVEVDKPASGRAPTPSREGTKFIGGHFPRARWDMFRKLGVELDKKGQELLEEALDDLLAKHGKL